MVSGSAGAIAKAIKILDSVPGMTPRRTSLFKARSLALLKQKGQDYWKELPSPRSMQRIAPQLVLLCITGLYLLSLTRIGLGLYRHRPIGYLTALCLGVAAYLLWRLTRSNLKHPIIKIAIVVPTIALMLLLFISNVPWFKWLFIVAGIWLLQQCLPHTTHRASRTSSNRTSSSGTTWVKGDCSDGGDGGGDSGGDGGCGGCGG